MSDEILSDTVVESWRFLELPAVLEEVAAYTYSFPGRERVLSAGPESSIDAIQDSLNLVREVREFIVRGGPQGFGDLVPLEGVLSRLENPATILDADEILAVRDVLALGSTVKNRFEGLGDTFERLTFHADKIIPLDALRRRIDRIFDENGAIRPSASHRLAEIHERTRAARRRIRKRLDAVVGDQDLARIVQEDYITMRNDRYVILLRPEFKGLLNGIVHDHSRSRESVYVEPLDVVELNNQVASLMDEEREEIRRILRELTEELRSVVDVLRSTYNQLAFLDAYQARALYAGATSSVMPELVEDGFRILGARHPLLLVAEESEVVPMDLIQDSSTAATVISGANMGGKTVALKIAGLFPLMARCGLMLPAKEGTRVQVSGRIMADIGDDQDIKSRVSSFSGHMLRIKAILDEARSGDLVLLDELGGATDPEEGAGLAMAIIDRLTGAHVRVVVTTHLTNLKAYALTRADVKNVSVEFHPKTLAPTFRLLYDLPGESHAIETAERIGMDSVVIASARTYADKTSGGSSTLIGNLQQRLAEVESLREELALERESLRTEAEKTRAERDHVVEEFRKTAREMMRNAEKRISDLQRSLKSGRIKSGPKPREELASIKTNIVRDLGIPLERHVQTPEVGSRVKVSSLGKTGTVKMILDGGKVDVAAGNLTIRADAEDLILLERIPGTQNASSKERIGIHFPSTTPKWEVNVIGLRVDEAVPIVEKALDEAILGGLKSLSIVHGKGTGRLKQGIREFLSGHPLVLGFRGGDMRQGGEGVTLVDIVSD